MVPMPELPDLEYIVERLSPCLTGRRVEEVTVKEPIVIRMLLPNAGGFADALPGRRIEGLARRGPFLDFPLDGGARLVVHCMLTGRLQLDGPDAKLGFTCFSLRLDDGQWLRYGDEKRMGKVYLLAADATGSIPGFDTQGVDVLSADFTWDHFIGLARGRRQQARVFLMDQTAISAIGNAYADEILFAAGIHPKTPCSALSEEELRRLYDGIGGVLRWGIEEVRKAGKPIEIKVRGHVKVRNRYGEPCPVCGTTIRRVGINGYDSFFCPSCQPLTRAADPKHRQIPW
jgi:formamidopyrimidine-DNA glycosylase